MKLIGSLTSPYVRKVRIALAETKIDYEFVLDSPWADDTGVPNVNPLGKVPVLMLDDGTPLFDSRVIVEHIDDLGSDPRLFPAAGRGRLEVKRWEALADGVCDAAVAVFLERKRPIAQQSADWIARQRDKIARGLDFANGELGDKPHYVDNALTFADLAVGVALGYLDLRVPDVAWRQDHPNLARLYDTLMHRRAFADTVPPDA